MHYLLNQKVLSLFSFSVVHLVTVFFPTAIFLFLGGGGQGILDNLLVYMFYK